MRLTVKLLKAKDKSGIQLPNVILIALCLYRTSQHKQTNISNQCHITLPETNSSPRKKNLPIGNPPPFFLGANRFVVGSGMGPPELGVHPETARINHRQTPEEELDLG